MNATLSMQHYVDTFHQCEPILAGANTAWLKAIRQQAISTFQHLGFPTTRNEDWKYTSLQNFVKSDFQIKQPTQTVSTLPEHFETTALSLTTHALVFVNGIFNPQLSTLTNLPAGIIITHLATAINQHTDIIKHHLGQYADINKHGFIALNAAFMHDGAFIYIAPNTYVDEALQLIFIHTEKNLATNLRNLIILGDHSRVAVIENYISVDDTPYFTNAITELAVGQHATAEYYKLQAESKQANHIATLAIHQAHTSSVTAHSFSIGGHLVRNDIDVKLNAEQANCTLNGLYLAQGRQHTDHHTRIDHLHPHCTSREFYKGIINDRARGVFNGKIIVHPNAQKTDTQQTNNNLLLSADAEIDTKPELEIYADDVKCMHGATVGQIDEDALFYLRSRGIEEAVARNLLTYAFAIDIFEQVKQPELRNYFRQLFTANLPAGLSLPEV